MKKIKNILLGSFALTLLVATSGCYGSFTVTKKLYKWNGQVSSDKWVQSILFYGLGVFQIYSFTVFIDAVVLNLVEFWTGSNPLAMSEGESDSQVVMSGNNVYSITASKNQFNITQTVGANRGKSVDLIYNQEETAWYATDGIDNVKLAQGDINSNEWVRLFYPDGTVEEIAMK